MQTIIVVFYLVLTAIMLWELKTRSGEVVMFYVGFVALLLLGIVIQYT